jgi:hypothetical protein
MTLIEKVQELQAVQPPLDPTEMKRRVAEWKSQTNYKAPEPVEVKIDDSTDTKDPIGESEKNIGSTGSDSGNGGSRAGSKIFSNYLQTGIDPFLNESFNDIYQRVSGKDLNEVYNQFEYDKGTELKEVVVTAEKDPFNYSVVGDYLGGAGLYADSGNIYEQMLQQELLSNLASDNNATTVNNLIDSGAISSLDQTSKRNKNENLYFNKSLFGKYVGGIFNNRFADVDDIKETIRFKETGPTIAIDYEGGEEFTYEEDIAGLNERLGGVKMYDLSGKEIRDTKKVTQKLNRKQLELKIKELERTGNEDANGNIVYSSDIANQLEDLYEILEDTGGRGFVPIDINAASDYWLNNQVDTFFNDLSGGDKISYQNKILNRGQYQLSEEEQNIRNAELKLRNKLYKTEEEKEELENYLGSKEEFYGTRLLDEDGKLIDFDKAKTQSQIISEASELNETTDEDVLKTNLAKANRKVVELAKVQLELNQQRANATEASLVKRGGRLKGSFTEGFKLLEDRNQLSQSQLDMLNIIVETGLIPEDYKYMSGSSRINDNFNEALQEYEVLNASLQLNKNPLAVKNREYFNTFANAVSSNFQGYGLKTPNIRTRKDGMKSFENVLRTNGYNEQDINYFSKNMENNFGESVIEGTTNLTFFAGELTIGRGLGASAGINRLARAGRVASKSFLKGRGLQKFYGVADDGFAGLVEAAEFGGLTAFKNLTLDQDESISGSAGFGFAMKFGGNQFLRFTKNLNKRLLDTQLITPIALVRDKSSVAMFSRNVKSAFGGSSSFMIGSTITDPLGTYDRGLQDFFYNYAKEFTNMFFYGGMSRGLKTKGGSFKAAYDAIGNDFLGFSRFNRSAKKATSYFDLSAEEIKNPSLEIDNKISDAVDKKLVEINKQLEDGTITEDKAAEQIIKTEQAQFAIENQITSNRVSDLIKQQRAEQNYPSGTEIYRAMQKYSQGIKFNDRDSQVFEYMSPEAILKELGGSYSKENIRFIEQLQDKELKIQRIMDGGASSIVLTSGASDYIPPSTYKVPISNTKLRNEVYDFLNKKINLDLTLQRLQNQSTKDMAPLEKDALKKEIDSLTKELESHMEGGEAAIEIQKKIDSAAATELSKQKRLDIQQETDAPLVTSKGEVTSEYLTNEKFVERLKQDGIEATPEDVAVTLSDGTIVYNESKMKNIKDFSTAAHEKAGHAIFFDTFKDAEGLVTEDGIKFINDMLNILPTSIREQVKAEVESRYDTSKPEKEWYEENLAVIAEFMKDGKIKYSESIGEQIRGVVPFFKRKGFDKLDIENPKDAFKLMQGLTEGLSEAQKSASEISVEQAGKRLTEQAVTETEAKDQSKKSRVVSEQAKELQDLLDNRALVESLKSRSTEDKFSVAQAFVEKNFGLVKDLFNTRSQAEENALKEILEEQILGEFPGSGNGKYSARNTNLFNSYDAAKESGGAKETTYFRNVLSKRIPEIDVAIKERTGTSPELPNQTKEFAPEPTTEKAKPTAAKQLPSKVKMKPEFVENLGIEVKEDQTPEQAIQEALKAQVLDSFKDVDIKKYKDLKTPRSLAEFYAKMLGIESEAGIKALMIPNRNFPASEKAAATRAKQFILDNLQAIHSRINIPGFKQTKVGKALLTEKGDLKPGSLKILKDIVSGKNITVEGYDGKPYEFNPLENGKPVPLYRRSQPLKVVLASYFKNNALEYLKTDKSDRVKLGAKFKKVAPELTIKQIEEAAKRKIGVDAKGNTLFRPSNIKQTRSEKYSVFGLNYENPRDKGKTYSTRDLEKLLPKELQAVESESVKDGIIRVTNEFLDSNPEYYNAIRDSVTAGVERGLLSTKEVFGTVVDSKKFKNVEQKGNRFPYLGKGGFLKPSFIKKFTGKDYIKSQKAQLDSFVNFFKGVEKYLTKNPKDAWYFDALVKDAQDNQNSIFRYSAPILFLNVGRNGKYPLNVSMREEHSTPQNRIGTMLLDAAIKGNVNQVSKLVKAIYMQGGVTRVDDALLDVDYKFGMPDFFWENVAPRIMSGELKLDNGLGAIIRMTEAGVNLDNYQYIVANKTFSEYFFGKKGLAQSVQAELIRDYFSGKKTAKQIKEYANERSKSFKAEAKQATTNNGLLGKNLKIDNKIEASDAEVVINELKTADAALENSRSLNIKDGKPVEKEKRKIRIFDFDDTLARSNSKVLVEMPDGKTFKINATQFAEKAAELEKDGAEFDFSEFSKVVEGKKGPLFDVAKKIADKRGTEDLFILTARPQDAAGPIREFMKALGIDIPLKNITGLADGKANAKGRWVMGKVAEGYNDFYFADDALKNVKAVKEVLDQADVKGKVQQAKFSKAKTFNTITNEMIEASSGIESFKTFSAAKAKTIGENKGRFDWLTMASSAEDFKGLLYKMIGKGKQGEAHFQFLKTNLIDPYNRAEDSAIQAKIAAANDFMALKSMYKTIPTTLKKETGVGKFTYQHALRTYMWTKQGMSIPGLSKADATKLNKFVIDSPELQTFADQLIVSQKGKRYPEPGNNWLAGNLTTDIIGGINKVNRAEYQKTFRENVDVIFSPENLNKMEAAYGTRWRKALEDTLRRMKSGSNRPIGGSEITNKVLDWTNNSVGAVMFLNTRSALLQTISAVNFLNWGDNNPIAAGKAFANQKQFWGDFMKLMNSDYLVQRRNGLKINVSESEIADAVKDSKNKVNAAISYLLSKGFVFTRYADSFAIASGGSTFYRNRIKKYVKEGMDQKLAEQKAFEDFKDVAEESQQSSDASKISMQQASGAGRVILNWANTPMQYVRIQKRAAQDLIAGRGDAKTHISKIAYYGAIQNLIFNSLQQALFAIGFGSDEDEDDSKIKARNEQKIIRVANGMVDSQLKGLGIAGAAMVATKNTIMKIIDESEKKRPEYEKAAIEALSFSPAISSKYRKVVGGLKSFSWNMKEIKAKGFSLDNPAYLAGSQIFTAFTNIPLDRVVKKVNNIRGILSEQTAEWQKIALSAGYSTYDVGLPYYGGWDAKADPTPEELKQIEFDKLKKDTKTQDQIDMLLNFGLTKKEIKALGKEDNRVKKIIELQNKKKKDATSRK